ncbi:MAG: hypothetical protein AAF511_10510 [Pseudomonadota bacterium]
MDILSFAIGMGLVAVLLRAPAAMLAMALLTIGVLATSWATSGLALAAVFDAVLFIVAAQLSYGMGIIVTAVLKGVSTPALPETATRQTP